MVLVNLCSQIRRKIDALAWVAFFLFFFVCLAFISILLASSSVRGFDSAQVKCGVSVG